MTQSPTVRFLTEATGAPIASAAPTPATASPAVTTTWLSSAFEHLRADPAPGARYPIKTGLAQEPCVRRFGGKYHMIYSGTGQQLYASCLETADPRIAANWSSGVGIFPNGTNAVHASLYIEGSTAYVYFTKSSDQLIYVATATIADMTTWTIQSTAVAGPIGNLSTKVTGNSFVIKDGSTYYMYAEGGNTATDSVGAFFPWMTYVATATSPTGPFTVQGTALLSLQPPTNGSVSGAWVVKENNKFVMYYHGQAWGRSGTPTDIYRATNVSPLTDTWVISNGGRPIFTRAHGLEVDQVADAELCLGPTGIPYLFYTGIDNTTAVFNVMATQLYPTRTQWNGNAWVVAEPIGGGEAPQWNAFVPRVTQNVAAFDPIGQSRTGTWALSASPAGMYGDACRTNTSAASGDLVTFDLLLTPGSYTLQVVYPTGPDQGIATLDLAYGSKFYNLPIGTIDQYSASATPNARTTLTFTIGGTAPAKAMLRFRTTTKNAASSGFRIADQGWTLARTDQ